MPKKIIRISGIIASFGMENESNVTPKTLEKSLDAVSPEDILVTINSPGGSVFAGLEMFSLLQNYPGNVETRIVSLAASMGSVLALAGNKKSAENTALYFVHNAQGFEFGDYRDLAKESKFLKDVSDLIANLYAEYTSLSLKEARQFMDDDSQFFGDDLELLGFEIVKANNNVTESMARVNAKKRFSDIKNKISKEEYDQDLEKVAACIDFEKFGIKNKSQRDITHTENKGETNFHKRDYPELSAEMQGNNHHGVIAENSKAVTPASAGENNREVITMTFEELLDQNPAAKAEFNTAIENAKKAEAEVINKRVEQASAFLTSDSTYPDSIKNLAVKVVSGEVGIESLNGAVAAFDVIMESQNSTAAQGESSELGDTPAGGGSLANEDGMIKNEVDLAQAVANDRKAAGMEAN